MDASTSTPPLHQPISAEPQIQTPMPVPVQPSSPITPTRKTAGIRLVFAAIAGLLILGATSYALLRLRPSSPAPSITVSASASPTPTATSDATAGWKTYTNTEFGYTFMYPKTVNVTTMANGEARLVGPVAAQQMSGETGISAVLSGSATTAVSPSYPLCAENRTTMTIGGFVAIRFDGCDLGSPLMLQWIGGRILYVATVRTDRDIVLDILSTFRLMKSAAE